MKAMVLSALGKQLALVERPDPQAGPGEIVVRVEACGVCRTDLHIVDGELPNIHLPIVPGHEIVGIVDRVGPGVSTSRVGERVGIPWLGHTCGVCPYCTTDRENLCDRPVFTGHGRDGGFATHVVADAAYAFPLSAFPDPVGTAPLLCAGLIGWRSLKLAGKGRRLGLYGFGAAAHIIAQICRPAARAARCGDPVRARRRVGAAGAWRCAQGRTRRLRRHSHERHSRFSLPTALGRAAGPLGCKPDEAGCRRIPGGGPPGGRDHHDHGLSPRVRQRGVVGPARRSLPGGCRAGSLTGAFAAGQGAPDSTE